MPKNKAIRLTADTDLANLDHIIIGSGIGGLTIATWLAKSGKKVAIFEQHYVPGGFSHTFKRRNGFSWDVGIHYVGNANVGNPLRDHFDFITDKKVEWASIGTVYDVVRIGEDVYEFKAGKENMRSQLYEWFPTEKVAIDSYFTLIEKSNKYGGAFFLEKTFKPILRHTIGKVIRKIYRKYSQKTTYEVINSLTENKRLIAVLCAQCGNYGLAPKKSSFAAHAMVIGHFLEGGYYPVGGVEKLTSAVVENIVKHDGQIFINAPVEEIVVRKNKVQGIKIKGRFIACESVISNVGINNTFNFLLGEEERRRCKFDLKETKPATGHLCLYVGLDASDETLNLPKNNVWHYKHDDIDEIINNSTLKTTTENFTYISFPSAKDPNWNLTHPNKSTIQAITRADYKWFEKYENTSWMKRGEEYNQLKEDFAEEMLEKLYGLFPQIKGHVIETEVSTPLSTKHFSNYQHGEIYGLEHTPQRFTLPFLRSETAIKGLRLVGQDITIVGFAGAMMSGMLTATTILKWGVWKHFKSMKKTK